MGSWLLVAIAIAACVFLLFSIGSMARRRRSEPADFVQAPARAKLSIDPAMLPDETHMAIREALARNRRIEAVGLLREASGMGLKEAKETIEAMERR